MARVATCVAPYRVEVLETDLAPMTETSVKVRSLCSGISAGTEMAAYRGTCPSLVSTKAGASP